MEPMSDIAAAFSFVRKFAPTLGSLYVIVMFIAFIILKVAIMGFMKRCGERL